jgi:hypothetical protein
MNTDKNGWPYLVTTLAIIGCVGGLVIATDKPSTLVFGCIGFIWFWSCIGLFLNLAFSEQLGKVPLHKKLLFSFFPLMYLSKPWHDWFLKEFNEKKGD